MSSDTLTHLIYASAAAPEFDSAELAPILQAARIKNAQRAVTGMLLYVSGAFFQVLEGERAVLTELFATISADQRHRGVTTIIHEPIARRAFGDWTMGFAAMDAADLEGIEGLSDFFQQGSSLASLPAGRAKKLLSAFAEGRWRTRVEGGAT